MVHTFDWKPHGMQEDGTRRFGCPLNRVISLSWTQRRWSLPTNATETADLMYKCALLCPSSATVSMAMCFMQQDRIAGHARSWEEDILRSVTCVHVQHAGPWMDKAWTKCTTLGFVAPTDIRRAMLPDGVLLCACDVL